MPDINAIRKAMVKRLASIPIKCRHAELSVIASADDDPTRPNDFLLDISMQAIQKARAMDLSDIRRRTIGSEYDTMELWPGEHYRLLAALVTVLKPKVVVEVGTAKGAAALAMKKFMDSGTKLATFDIVPWDKSGGFFKDSDFEGGLEQHVDDLTDIKTVKKHEKLLKSADLFFIDAAKDGKMEYRFMENFKEIGLKEGAIIVFDDTKVWNMLHFWRTLDYPKLDLTSFGHWSGTGIMQWRNK